MLQLVECNFCRAKATTLRNGQRHGDGDGQRQWRLRWLRVTETAMADGKGDGDSDGCYIGKSVRNPAEFCDYSDFGPFGLRNFHQNFIFPIVKCVPTNSEHVFSGSESSPAIYSSDFMNWKTFLRSVYFWPAMKISSHIVAGIPKDIRSCRRSYNPRSGDELNRSLIKLHVLYLPHECRGRGFLNFFFTPHNASPPIQFNRIASASPSIISPRGNGIKGNPNTSLIGSCSGYPPIPYSP